MSVGGTSRINSLHSLQRVAFELYGTASKIRVLGHHFGEELVDLSVSSDIVRFETNRERDRRLACSTEWIRNAGPKGTVKLWERGCAIRDSKRIKIHEWSQVWQGFVNRTKVGELETDDRLIPLISVLGTSGPAYLCINIWIEDV